MAFEKLANEELEVLAKAADCRGRPGVKDEIDRKLESLGYLRTSKNMTSITKAGKLRLANERSLRRV